MTSDHMADGQLKACRVSSVFLQVLAAASKPHDACRLKVRRECLPIVFRVCS